MTFLEKNASFYKKKQTILLNFTTVFSYFCYLNLEKANQVTSSYPLTSNIYLIKNYFMKNELVQEKNYLLFLLLFTIAVDKQYF